MQTSTQAQAATAAAPAPAATVTAPVTITTVGPDGSPQKLNVPRTEEEVSALVARRQELSNQLENVSGRRSNLAQEIQQTALPGARTGLEERLRLLDNRILQLESDIAVTGRELTLAPAELVANARQETAPPPGDQFDEGFMAGGASGVALIAVILFFLRRRWKRAGRRSYGLTDNSTARFDRLEQGMEAIAIEIERVSEGQRFVTKLLSESQGQLSPSNRLAQPAGIQRDDPVSR